MPFRLLRRLIYSSNPFLWLATGGLFIFGVASAVAEVPGADKALQSGVLAIFGYLAWYVVGENLYAVLLNNYYDAEIDAKNPRKTAYEAVYDDDLFWPYWFAMCFACVWYVILLIIFPSIHMALYGLALLVANILYDIPPIRVKEWPVLDIVVGEICLIVPMFAGYSLLTGDWPPMWAWVAAFLAFGAFELFHKTFDIEADDSMGVVTSATKLGGRYSIIVCAFLLLGAAVFVYAGRHSLVEAAGLALYLVMPAVWLLQSSRAAQDRLYGAVRASYIINAGILCSYVFGAALARFF